jgi:DNA adenine methylase
MAAQPTSAAPADIPAAKPKKEPKTPVEELLAERKREATLARFLFYPGQKGTIVERIASLIPKDAVRLIEPFTGSASVPAALAFRFKEIRCSDAMPAVIAAHNRAITDPAGFCADIQALFNAPTANTEQYFYHLREDRYNAKSTVLADKAAILVYLNRKAAMGLVRHNDEGGFSAPWHESKIGNPPPLRQIRDFAKRLKGKAVFMLRDFREALFEAGPGDFVYCDPPYLPEGEKTQTFTGYSDKFGIKDHEDLAALAQLAAARGAKVVISNHDSPLVRQIYASATRFIALDVDRKAGRKKGEKAKTTAAEILAIWSPMRVKARQMAAPSPAVVLGPGVPPAFREPRLKRLRLENTIDPYNRHADIPTLDRRVYEIAEANGWLTATARPDRIGFRSFTDSGQYLLRIARSGTPSMRRLVLHRPGREHHVSLHLLNKTCKALAAGKITFGQAEKSAARLLALADGLETVLAETPGAERLVERALKLKAHVFFTQPLDIAGLPKRYEGVLDATAQQHWQERSEEEHRLLLVAELCADEDTNDFRALCRTLGEGKSIAEFKVAVPAIKEGKSHGVRPEKHVRQPPGYIAAIRARMKPAKSSKKPKPVK